jgi:tetratricopeptide (TPR) repeat protein
MPLFDGLGLGELVLLVGGCLFFVVLLIVFLKKALSNQPYKGLLLFFVIPIVMIGFPAITSFKISQEGVEIDKQTTALQSNPNDETTRKSLETNVSDLKNRPFKNPQIIASLAKAQYALGREADAKQNLEKALKADPTLQPAQELKAKIEIADKVSALTAAAEKEPANPEVKRQLQNTVAQANQYKFANPKALQEMQKATRILRPETAVEAAPKN